MRTRLRDRVANFLRGSGQHTGALGGGGTDLMDLPLNQRRELASYDAEDRRRAIEEHRRRESLTLSPMAGLIDADDGSFRRLTSGNKFRRRDLTPLQQDRMLEISWYLWEQNPFARRLITCMTDLVVGEGVGYEAEEPKILDAAGKVWNHPINRLGERARELHNALALNGELILPVAVNDISGVPTIGFIDPYQVEDIETRPDNILVPTFVRLKKTPEETVGRRIPIIQQNPMTGELEGECFYFAINKLPNSLRGRSDLLPLADWLDLFDQYMFAEVERVRLLSAFVWDLEIKDGTPDQIKTRLAEIGTLQSGTIFGRNQNEKLEAQSAQLNASDRSETARLLTIHIAGSLGMPIQWFGWPDSTNATMQGQNDVAMKTPAARQKEFGALLNAIVAFGVHKQRTANKVLFRDLKSEGFGVVMPEIASKDISRAAAGLAQVVGAMDQAMSNSTVSRRVAATIQIALTKHLVSGFDVKVDDMLKDADSEAEERRDRQDELMAGAAAAGKLGGKGNPPPKGSGSQVPQPSGSRKGEGDLEVEDLGNVDSLADLPLIQ